MFHSYLASPAAWFLAVAFALNIFVVDVSPVSDHQPCPRFKTYWRYGYTAVAVVLFNGTRQVCLKTVSAARNRDYSLM